MMCNRPSGGYHPVVGQNKEVKFMDVGTMLNELRYPGGLDFYPVVTQVLMILTWTFHMFFVNLLIGGLGLSMYGFLKKDRMWNKASISLTKIAKISFSLAIVFGVAPLLFTQVIYDPLWYASNNLSASWVISFIPILIIGYYMLYIFYFKNKEGAKKSIIIFPILSIFFVGAAGAIMHVFSYQELFPDRWVDWYTSGGEGMNTDGWHIYAFNLPRYFMFIFLSFAVTGVYMTLYSWYFRKRKDMDSDYLDWFAKMGTKIAIWFGVITVADSIIYLAMDGFLSHPAAIAALAVLSVTIVFVYSVRNNAVQFGLLSTLLAFLSILAVSIMREAIRMASVAKFGYSIYDYKVVMDVMGPFLFLGTLSVGIGLFVFMLYTSFQAGRKEGVYEADKSENASKYWVFSFYILVVYIVVFIGTGLIIIGKNFI